jgi:hypothetical protein
MKKNYQSPQMECLDVEPEQMLAASGPNVYRSDKAVDLNFEALGNSRNSMDLGNGSLWD